MGHEVMIQLCINRLRPWVWDLSLVVLPTRCYYLVTRALYHIIKYIHKCYFRTTTQTFAVYEAKNGPCGGSSCKKPWCVLSMFETFAVFAKVLVFVLCFLVAAVQITKLGDQLLAVDSTAGKAVFPISHLHQQHFWWIQTNHHNFPHSKC